MAGASFSTGFNAVAGMPRPPKPGLPARPKSTGASLTGLHNPMQHPGASLTGLTAAQPPKQTAPTTTPPKVSGTTTTPAQSPLDSTYFQQIAADQLRLGNQVNGLTAQSQNANTGLQSALAQLAYQQPRDSLRLEQGANRRGALYSSAYTQDLGNLGNQYLTRQSGMTTANGQKQDAIAARIAALNQNEPLVEAGDYDAAVARAVKAALANPATGQPPAGQSSTINTPPPGITINGRPAPSGTVRRNGTLNVNVPKVRSGFGYRGGF